MRRAKSDQSFKDLLARYKTHLRAPQGTVIHEVVLAYRSLGLPCEERHVSYSPKTRTITIVASGPQKTEMLLRKHLILTALKESLGTRDTPKEIV